MKALVLTDYGKFVYQDYPTPKVAEDEVLIHIKACAVCGSDVHGMDGSTGRRQPPLVMGHEASGEIISCGEKVKRFKEKDRVTFDSTVYCGECDMCRKGNVNLCGNRRVLGVSCDEYKKDGAFAEYIAVPERILYPLPDNVSFSEAAMTEPLSIAYHAATRTEIEPGSSVVIVGIGTIGLLVLQVVKSMKAGQIIAVDIDENRLALAKQLGATDVICSKDQDAAEQIKRVTANSAGADYAFDATGIGVTVALCLSATKLDGKIVLIGNLAQSIDFPLQWVVTRQLSLFGSCASAGEYPQCLDLISQHSVNVNSLISKTVPLSEGNEWLNRLYHHEPGLYKIVLIP